MQDPHKGNDIGENPPITPTVLFPTGLYNELQQVYDYICQHFFASISEDVEVEETEVTFQVSDQTFTLIGQKKISEGYTKYTPDINFKEKLISECK